MRIVVVEDVPMVRARIVDALLELSNVFVVGEADSVETALSAIESKQPDTVLLDMSLPSKSLITGGMGILKWVKRMYPAIHVVMLTNHVSQAYREACKVAGATYFLDKSYEFDKLPVVIEQLNDDFMQHRGDIHSMPFKPGQNIIDKTRADHLLAEYLHWPVQNVRRLMVWMYFLLTMFSYVQASRNESRKG